LIVIEFAEAAGTVASAAAMTNAKTETLKLLLRTTVPPLGSEFGSWVIPAR